MAAYFQTLDETIQLTETFLTARPYAYVTNSVRTSATTLLRLRRRPTRYVTIDLPPHYGYLEPGDTIWSSHELLPESATGSDRYQTWALVPLHIIEIRDRLSPPQLQLKCVDLREVYCSFWSPFLTDIGMTDDLNGIAILDRAGGWRTVRDGLAYGERPPAWGYCAFQEVLAHAPIIDAFGLLIQGGDDRNILLNSVLSEGGPGNTFTNWSSTTSGSAIAVEWPLYTLVDANGFRRSLQFATYNSGENAYISQTVGNAAGAYRYLFAKVYYKNGGAYDDMTIRIQRSDTSEYWRDSDSTWQAAAQDNAISPKTGSTEIYYRWLSKLMDLGGATANITVSVGHFACASAIPQISQLQAVELIRVGENRTAEGYRNLLPTKAAETIRVDNNTFITNDSAVRVLSPTRGFVKLNFRPLWGNSDLDDNQIKGIWEAAFDGITDGQGLTCYYIRLGANSGEWRLKNKTHNAYASLAVTDVVRDQDYTIICRWTSDAVDEHNMVGQALDIWVDGVRGTTYPGAVTQTASAVCDVHIGSYVTALEKNHADGHFTFLTMGLHCPTEAELFRL
ncbi:MAG: hypothetical protein RL409_219 [Gemmatimonadota bacterium]|jgi:hypothetical protein